MKLFRFAAFALALLATPVAAQWQTPTHSVPVGRGGGSIGFASVLPGTAGLPFLSNGPVTDPSYQVLGLSGGGTGQTSRTDALTALMPTPTAPGQLLQWNGSAWVLTSAVAVPSYNLATYGAVPGADTANRNSNAIAAALAACATSPGLIWVPAGVYQYGTSQQQTTGGCGFAGEGQGASNLQYTGGGIGLLIGKTTGNNLQQIVYRDIQLSCSAACSNAVYIQNVSESIVFDNVAFNAGGAGTHAVQITSATAVSGGSYDVHFINGTVIQNCTGACVIIDPQAIGFSQAVYFSDVFFNGYSGNALLATSGTGIYLHHIHVERHLGFSVTVAAIHIDTTAQVELTGGSYFEDEANACQIELGSAVASVNISGNFASINVLGGTHTGACFVAGTQFSQNVRVERNSISAGGSIGKVIDFSAPGSLTGLSVAENYINVGNGTNVIDMGNATASNAMFNTLVVGTVNNGIASAVGQTAVDAAGNTGIGTFSGALLNFATGAACSGLPSASFFTNGFGRVTHC